MITHQVDSLSPEQVRTNLGFPVHISDPIRITEVCDICGKIVRMMVFRGTGVCSEGCRKIHIQKEIANASG